MNNQESFNRWERRWHPLREEWVVYAAHRNNRPWSVGRQDKPKNEAPEFDPICYLCPGNKRISGNQNPDYQGVYIFNNDHPVVGIDAPEIDETQKVTGHGLYIKERADGVARVVCYHPKHNITLTQVTRKRVTDVFAAFRSQTEELSQLDYVKNILIFENKGEIVGVSNPHPHCQIYAVNFHLNIITRQLTAAKNYREKSGRNVFETIIENEKADGRRIIFENDHAIAFVPFFARYAYEVMIFPKKRHQTLITLSDDELSGLAEAFLVVTRKYDLNFAIDFPYVMAIQQAPVDGGDYSDFHCHFLFLPPLRQPGLRKFLAGPEIGAETFMADTMPEDKALELINTDISGYNEIE